MRSWRRRCRDGGPAYLVFGLLLAALPAMAQAQPARPRRRPPQAHAPAPPAPPPKPLVVEEPAMARCRELLRFGIVTSGPATVETIDGDGCRYTGVRFGFTDRFGYEAATLVEHGFPSDVPNKPVSVQIEARGIVLAITSGNARTDWLSRQQQIPFDVTVDAGYDPAAKAFTLRSLAFDGPTLGRTEIALELAGVDTRNFPDDVAVRSLRLHMDSQRFPLQFALGAAVASLPDGVPGEEPGEEPGAAMDAAKARAVTLVRTYMPLTSATPDAVDAVSAFVADFPRPQHVLDLAVTASLPFKLRSVGDAADKADLARAVLRGLTVTATYAGDPK